jgi:hypothetical protein
MTPCWPRSRPPRRRRPRPPLRTLCRAFPRATGKWALFTYTAQSGDTLPAVAARFGVSRRVQRSTAFPPPRLIDTGLPLIIPNALPPAAYPHR